MKRLAHFFQMLAFLCDPETREQVFERPRNGVSVWRAAWCRLRGHPDGPVFFDPIGTEPDMRCKNCGDDLG